MSALSAPRATHARQALYAVSELTDAADLIRDPGLRVQGLAALLTAATAWGGSPRRIRQRLDASLGELQSQRRLHPALRAAFIDLLDTPGPTLPMQLSQLQRTQRRSDPRWMITGLLNVGLIDIARQTADALPCTPGKGAMQRTRAVRLAQTGIQQQRHRRFVADPAQAHRFPPSLPAFLRCAEALTIPEGATAAAVHRNALTLLEALRPAAQQRALVSWCEVQWHRSGERAARSVLRRIRYRSLRRVAEERLAQLALHPSSPPAPNSGAHKLLRGGDVSAAQLREWLRRPAAAGDLLAALEEDGRPLIESLHRLCGVVETDRLWCTLLLRQGMRLFQSAAQAVAAEPEFEAGLRRGPVPEGDGASPARALYDEGLSLSAAGHSRRRVLARACRAVLLKAAREPAAGQAAEPRLRTLTHLSGAVAAEALDDVLQCAPPGGSLCIQSLTALIPMDPHRAVSHLHRLSGVLSLAQLSAALPALEQRRALPPGTTLAWQKLLNTANPQWLQQTIRRWSALKDRLPTPGELTGLLREGHYAPDRDPVALLRHAEEAVSALCRRRYLQLPGMLTRSALLRERQSWLQPASLPRWTAPWSDAQILRALQIMAAQGRISEKLLAEALRPFPDWAQLRDVLVEGVCPLAGGPVIPLLGRWQLRLLDKRRDLLTWMRFADAAPCCWRSMGPHYGTTRTRMLATWCDPLSFCVHVERQEGAQARPVGFVFGVLAEAGDREPAALLNGLYLSRGRTLTRRSEILETLRRALVPLGVRHIGIASQYQGAGPMPKHWRRSTRRIFRRRPLERAMPVTQPGDDISAEVNKPLTVRHLLWCEL